MNSERAFRALLDETEARYETCLDSLIALKRGVTSPGFITFQGTLAKALLSLSQMDHALAEEHRRIVTDKARHARSWLRRRWLS